MNNTDAFQTISNDDLTTTTGGLPSWAKKAVKVVAKKAGPIGAAYSGYSAVDGYLDARDKGNSVPKSLAKGAWAAVW